MFKFVLGIAVAMIVYNMGPDIKRYFIESGGIDVAIEKLEDIKE